MPPPRQRPARRGSVLLGALVAFVVFASAYVAFAASQVAHAERIDADYGRLQATYAAESAVYEAFARKADVPTTTLWSDGANGATYAAVREAASTPTWIRGTGKAVFHGETYEATVRGYHVGTQILLWDFGP